MSADEQTHVSGKSWVPAAFAWGALVLGIYLGREVTGALGDMRAEMVSMRRDVSELVRISNDSVSLDKFALWRAQFALANPGMNIPNMPSHRNP